MIGSSLVNYVRLSPNNYGRRTHKIDTITLHHMSGNLTVQSCGAWFAQPSTKASANYGVDSRGQIGQYVDEDYAAYASCDYTNDNRAITIEVANDGDATTGWHVSDKAVAALIELLVDICRRYEIKKLLWKADPYLIGQVDKQNMTVHRWFASTDCPGPYLLSMHGKIADEVNKRLEEDNMPRYNTIAEMPGYARPTIKKLCDKHILNGKDSSKDKEGYPAKLDLSEDMIRIFVINDKAGIYDK